MNEHIMLTVIAALPVSLKTLIIAGIILALVVGAASFFIYRSGGKKGTDADNKAASDWQRQGQQSTPGAGGWNQQGAGTSNDNGWGQQAGGWGSQSTNQQGASWGASAQQQPPNAWGTQAAMQQGQPQQAPQWGTQGNSGFPQQPQQPAWGGIPNASSQPAKSPWNGQQGQQGQQASAPQWGSQANQEQNARAPWEANAAPISQDAWGQPSAASAQPNMPWGQQANVVPQPQQQSAQAQTAWNQSQSAFNAGNGQGGQADNWGAFSPQQPYTAQGANNAMVGRNGQAASASAGQQASSWQQNGSFGPSGAPVGTRQDSNPAFGNANGGFGSMDGDKTMLRSTPPPIGLGIVRVEEGKEPGREYEIRKEALSIGRSRESDIFLEDLAVSRLHASVVSLGNGNYALKDEGSANGTKVNGQLVNKYQIYPLQDGDRIQLGQTVLVFGRR